MRWLLNQTPDAPAPSIVAAAAELVRQTLCAIPDDTDPKQIASNLAIGFLSQFASHVQSRFTSCGDDCQFWRPTGRPDARQCLGSPISLQRPIAGQAPVRWAERPYCQDRLLTGRHAQDCVVVLQGAPGVGKSELAREYARLRRTRYARGAFAIEASTSGFALQLAALGEKILGLSFPAEMNFDDRGQRTFSALSQEPSCYVHGRVDHDSLGISLHAVGYCYGRTGHFAEARPWYERAVVEAEKGDVHGRVDREIVTRLLQDLEECLRKLGRSEAARQG